MTIEVSNLRAGYTKIPVLHDISFQVNPGEICGLIGLNGAGKSTTIKVITGLLTPMSGKVTLDGKQINDNPKAYRQSVGVIPESPTLYEELTLREHLEVTAIAYGQNNKETMDRGLELVDKFRLSNQLDWFPAYFSKGMKQKVLIVCALMLDLPLYVVDEPFLGLDPLGIRTLLNCLEEKKATGAAILMSTHVLDTAERFCDSFVVLHEGKVKAEGSLDELRLEYANGDSLTLEEIYFQLTSEDEASE